MRCTIVRIRVMRAQKRYRDIELRIYEKSKTAPIRVCFLVTVLSKWKDEELYKLMDQSDLFIPIVIGTPYTTDIYKLVRYEEQTLIREYCISRHYNYHDGYDSKSGKVVQLDKFNPDIVFLCEPYENWIDESYRICGKKINYLPCHTPYSYWMTKVIYPSLSEYHSTTWRQYYCNEYQRVSIQKNAIIGDHNLRIVGYQTIDTLMCSKSSCHDWTSDDGNRKRIIIAPHYSIPGPSSNNWAYYRGTFLDYAESLQNIAVKYRNEAVFAFKPHPGLYIRLVEVWGKKRTDEYYRFWDTADNTILAKGDYIELFRSSDAMIHDSGSFIVEYLSTGKPLLFLANNEQFMKREYDDFGIRCLDMHYKAYSVDDVWSFVDNVVINKRDDRLEERKEFIDEALRPVNGKSAAESIIDDITINCLSRETI